MLARIRKTFEQLLEKWNNLERTKKTKLIAIVAIVAVALGFTIFFLTRPKMTTLNYTFDNKTLAQAQEILNSNNIPTEVSTATGAIQVRQQDVNKANLILATEGIPSPPFTYEDYLSSATMQTTESVKRQSAIKYKEAQLSQDIASLSNIKSASVTLAIPDTSNRVLSSEPLPSASVRIEPNGELTNTQINGIALHVSRGVEGLSVSNISIIDNNGVPLLDPSEEGSASAAMSKLTELEELQSRKTVDRVKEILDPLYDDVRVSANIKLDTHNVTENKKEYTSADADTTTGIPSRQTTEKATYEGVDAASEPGLQNNTLVTPQYNIGQGGTSSATQNKVDTEYLVNETNIITESLPGNVILTDSSLTVSLIRYRTYDQKTLTDNGTLDNTTWTDYKEGIVNEGFTVDDVLIDSISKATGIDAARINIMGNVLPRFIDLEVEPGRPLDQLLMAGLLLLLIALLAIGLIRRTQPEEITEIEPELSVEELLVSSGDANKETIPEIDYVIDSELKLAIDKFIDEKPEAAAQLLRNWLTEEWE